MLWTKPGEPLQSDFEFRAGQIYAKKFRKPLAVRGDGKTMHVTLPEGSKKFWLVGPPQIHWGERFEPKNFNS